MKKEIFRGVGTALVTPFKGGRIDYSALERLIERQIGAGVEALIIGGTTGEAATLRDEERYELFRAAKEYCRGRARLIFGTGTNDTRRAVMHTATAEKIGCDGVLTVTPYYNKGTREGLYKHYETIAKCTSLPIILYNVPSRTGVDLKPETVGRLASLDNIVAIKEAGGGAARLAELSGEDIALYAGNDSEICDALDAGGSGVISVVSNLLPKRTREITEKYFNGDTAGARAAEAELLPLIDALFLDTNPAPVKYALSAMGLCDEEMRLPLYPIDNDTRVRIMRVLDNYSLE